MKPRPMSTAEIQSAHDEGAVSDLATAPALPAPRLSPLRQAGAPVIGDFCSASCRKRANRK